MGYIKDFMWSYKAMIHYKRIGKKEPKYNKLYLYHRDTVIWYVKETFKRLLFWCYDKHKPF